MNRTVKALSFLLLIKFLQSWIWLSPKVGAGYCPLNVPSDNVGRVLCLPSPKGRFFVGHNRPGITSLGHLQKSRISAATLCALRIAPVRPHTGLSGSYPAWPLKSPHGADTGETAGGYRFSGTRRVRTQGRKPRSFALLLHTRYMQTPCLWHKIEERTISAFALLRPSTYQHPFPMTALLS